MKTFNFKFNYQLILLLIFSITYFLDFFEIVNFGYGRLFYKVKPIFADLITIIPTKFELNEILLNENQRFSSTETMNRSMNYPILWVYIFDYLNNFTIPHIFFGNAQLILYFLVLIIYHLFKNFNFLNFFIFLSPPIFLLLDRGNNDLIIFFLILIAVNLNGFFSGLIIGIASALKIYPIFLCFIYLNFSKKKVSFLLGFLITLPIIYMSFKDLFLYVSTTSISFSSSFGILSFSLLLKKIILIFFNSTISVYLLFFISLIFFIILCLFFNSFLKYEINKILIKISSTQINIKVFLIFSSLSIFIFLIFSNWAYRIIFLVPATVVLINNFEFNRLYKIKSIIIFSLITGPFLSTWIILPINQILLNHYSWAFYSLTCLVSFSFYFILLLKLIRLRILFRNSLTF